MGGSSGWHRQQSGSSVLLEKLWTKILVEPLSRAELSQVILYLRKRYFLSKDEEKITKKKKHFLTLD